MTDPLRILVDLTHLLPGGANGGVKPFVFELLGWLGRQQRRPLRLTYLTRASSHAEVRDRLARVEDELLCVVDDTGGAALPKCLPISHPRERVWLRPPPGLARRLGAQLVWSPFGPPDFACEGIPALCVVVDVLHRDFPATLAPAEIEHREAYFRRMVERADALQCITHHVVGRMHEIYGVPRERLFHTHIVIHSRLRPGVQGAAGEDPCFFYPANFWTHKNHEVLLLAWRIYRERARAAGRAPWKLVLTGHEDGRSAQMRALAATLGLDSGEVEFRGFVSQEQLAALWSQAGALVFPSLHEGFGIPLLEAMHAGVPVISSDATSLPEVGGDACLYVDARRPEAVAEAMERISTDPDLARGLVARGRARLREFSMSREGERLLDRMGELAGKAAAGALFAEGIHADGWTEREALVGLPAAAGRCELEIRTHPMPAARRLAVAAGEAEFGAYDLPAGEPGCVRLALYPQGAPLRLTVPDAASLAASDPRAHGVLLASVRLLRAGEPAIDLFPPAA